MSSQLYSGILGPSTLFQITLSKSKTNKQKLHSQKANTNFAGLTEAEVSNPKKKVHKFNICNHVSRRNKIYHTLGNILCQSCAKCHFYDGRGGGEGEAY